MTRFATITAAAALLASSAPASASTSAPVRRDFRKGTNVSPKKQSHRAKRLQNEKRLPLVKKLVPNSGAPGTAVTIYGRHFTKGTKVNYGNLSLVPTRVASSKIVFLVPPGATDAAISLDVPRVRSHLFVGSFDAVAPVTAAPPVETAAKKGKKSRKARKKLTKARINKRYRKSFLRQKNVRAEMTRHGRRIAKLNRMLQIAGSMQGLERLEIRIRRAIVKENRRHSRVMLAMQRSYIKKKRSKRRA